MDKLRICIGSNDGIVIASTHMGDTKRFLIYDVFKQREAVKIDERENTAIDMGHSAMEKMKAVLEIISDVHVLVARKNSPNFRKIAVQTQYQPIVISNAHDTLEILVLIQENFHEIFEMVEERRGGGRDEKIPEFRRASF
jgi:CO dehydrogenase/acetyl-CoA synthase gamma subunit (corrinoid Fe-S protein)